MSTFAERVEAISGVETSDITEGLLSTWLSESAKEVINILPPQVLYKAATTFEYSNEADDILDMTENVNDKIGTEVPESRILNVIRWTQEYQLDLQTYIDELPYECVEIDAALRGRAYIESGYMEEATQQNPVFFRLSGKVYVLPNPVSFAATGINERAEISYVLSSRFSEIFTTLYCTVLCVFSTSFPSFSSEVIAQIDSLSGVPEKPFITNKLFTVIAPVVASIVPERLPLFII